MKKPILTLSLIFATFPALATPPTPVCFFTAPGVCANVTASNPLPITTSMADGIIDIGTSISMTNPQIASDATSGFYTPTTSTVAVVGGGVEIEQWNTASGAVNYISITPSATLSPPIIASAGSDTNIALDLKSKATGGINLITGGGTQTAIVNTASSVDYLTLTGSATASVGTPTIAVVGTDTNISLILTPKGSGGIGLTGVTTGAMLCLTSGGLVGHCTSSSSCLTTCTCTCSVN